MSDGYTTRENWTDEGWEWVQFKQARHPLFWVCTQNCKSGCGGQLASHSHCQKNYFTLAEMDQLTSDTSSNGHHQVENFLTYDQNKNREFKEFPYKYSALNIKNIYSNV